MTGEGDSPQWRQRVALSWQVLSELARRHPAGAIFQEWPASGYDELMFVDRPEHTHDIIGFNRDGSVHVKPEWYEPGSGWWHASVSGPRRYALRMEQVFGLDRPPSTPVTTRKTLSYRVLSAICSQSLLSNTFLDPRPGYTVGQDGGGIDESYFGSFPGAAATMTPEAQAFDFGSGRLAPQHYWFLIPYMTSTQDPSGEGPPLGTSEKVPVAVLNIGAKLWVGASPVIDLMAAYERLDRKFLPLMLEVFPLFAPVGPRSGDEEPNQ